MPRLEVRLPRHRQKCLFIGFKIGFYGSCHSIFRTLEVICVRLDVCLPKYGRKRKFDGFEIEFKAFAVLFLEHWKLFCVD